MKNYSYDFKERNKYDETFVDNNSGFIQKLTGAVSVFDISKIPLVKRAGFDNLILICKKLSELDKENIPII